MAVAVPQLPGLAWVGLQLSGLQPPATLPPGGLCGRCGRWGLQDPLHAAPTLPPPPAPTLPPPCPASTPSPRHLHAISTPSPPYLHPQVCGELIPVKALRVGIEQEEKGWGEIIRWSHLDCTRLPALRDEIDLGVNEIAGLDDLAPEEQHLVREMVWRSWLGFGVGFAVASPNPNLNPHPDH